MICFLGRISSLSHSRRWLELGSRDWERKASAISPALLFPARAGGKFSAKGINQGPAGRTCRLSAPPAGWQVRAPPAPMGWPWGSHPMGRELKEPTSPLEAQHNTGHFLLPPQTCLYLPFPLPGAISHVSGGWGWIPGATCIQTAQNHG